MNKTCVIGWPIAHSRSPLIHTYWMKKYGIDGRYETRAVEPQDLETFIRGLARSDLIGCNVTIPHKESALAFVDHCDDSVKAIGALNTIYIRNGQSFATSTDGEGFYQNLISHHPRFDPTEKNIVILGAGGSAKAIIERLTRTKVGSITVANRTLARALSLKDTFGSRIIPVLPEKLLLENCDLLINTTSQGMTGQPPNQIDLNPLPRSAIVADIVYVPLKTELLKNAETRGNPIVTGLGMLLHQAVRGFELWYGVRPEVTTELYNLVAKNIDPDFEP